MYRHWNIAAYCQHLATPGGQNRLWKLGGDALSTTEIRRIHETKQDAFAASLVGGIAPRPGIVDTLTAARAAGLRIGFVTTGKAHGDLMETLRLLGLDAKAAEEVAQRAAAHAEQVREGLRKEYKAETSASGLDAQQEHDKQIQALLAKKDYAAAAALQEEVAQGSAADAKP